MKWSWKMNFYCHFCQKEHLDNDDTPETSGVPYKPCDAILVDINNKLAPVFICEKCYNNKREIEEE